MQIAHYADLESSRGRRRFLLVGPALLVLAGCDLFTATDCHHGISFEVSPESIELEVGESFRPEYREVGCDWERTVSQTWVTTDSTILEIDSTRRVRALQPGSADVWPELFSDNPQLRIQVTVSP